LPDADTLTFVLNHAFEVGTVRAGRGGPVLDYDGYYDGEWLGEGSVYDVAVPDSLGPVASLCVAYSGAVPVFDGHPVPDDWKGRIVANHGTLRATEQSKWYPIVRDRKSGALSTQVSYDITVDCADCRQLYINGSAPAAGPSARFTSDVPRALLLFAGDFSVTRTAGLEFVGGAIDERAAAVFRDQLDATTSGFERFLGIEYEGSPVFLTFLSIAKRRTPGRSSWAFVSWPTVAFDGAIDFGSLVETAADGTALLPLWLRRTLGHELAHYYFGTVLRPTGPLFWFYVESMAEYMSLRRMAVAESDSVFADNVRELRDGALRAGPVSPLSRIEQASQIGDSYRYQLAPLWLLSLEERAGEAAMGRLLGTVLTAPAERQRDWPFFLDAAAAAGIPDTVLSEWVAKCVEAPITDNCIAEVGASRFRGGAR